MITSENRYCAEIFNLATGNAYSALEIAKTIYKVLGKEFVYEKGESKKFWDKYEELFNKKYNLSKERVEQEVFKHCLGDGSKIQREFNYLPETNLEDGVKEIIRYQKNFK